MFNQKGTKDNSKKSGYAADRKVQKRLESDARNLKYRALSLDEKIARNSTKVIAKLKREVI